VRGEEEGKRELPIQALGLRHLAPSPQPLTLVKRSSTGDDDDSDDAS
jgi:hypothetical protein